MVYFPQASIANFGYKFSSFSKHQKTLKFTQIINYIFMLGTGMYSMSLILGVIWGLEVVKTVVFEFGRNRIEAN